MKKTMLASVIACTALFLSAKDYDHHFLLAGASFAVPANGWFELVCNSFNAEAMNKAVSGQAIYHTAVDMYNGEFYTAEELERTDAFIIMHVHDQNVASTDGIKENYEDYTYDDIKQRYNLGYDYVIKKYKADCYNLRNNPESKYYGTENGKPATIILCTHWHDARTTYNPAIRKLAERWQLPLVKWDDNIGFTRTVPDEDGTQPSVKYSRDTETKWGIKFGWHPQEGQGRYIQQKMAGICMAELEKLFGTLPVSATVSEKSGIVAPEEKAYFFASFTGVPPWDFTYSVNGEEHTLTGIETTPAMIKITTDNDKNTVLPVSVSNKGYDNGTVAGEANIYMGGQSLPAVFDAFAHEYNKTTAYVDADHLEVKGNTENWSREAFISFDVNDITPEAEKIVLRTYYYERIYPNNKDIIETHYLEIAGNTSRYSTLTWNTKPTDFTVIGEKIITADELNMFIDWDVTDWAKEQIAAGHDYITLRLRYGQTDAGGLLYFYSNEAEHANKPHLRVYPASGVTGQQCVSNSKLKAYTNLQSKEIIVSGISKPCTLALYAGNGQSCFTRQINSTTGQETICLPTLAAGVYVLHMQSDRDNRSCKVIF